MRSRILLLALVLLTSLGACEDSGVGPDPIEPGEQVPEDKLTFLRFAESAPDLADSAVSFWAVRGEDRSVEVRLAPTADDEEGEDFLEFEVPGNALLKYPDGRAFARGDSVLITIRVVDATRFLFHFEPSGLRFDPKNPAELEVSYEYADRDFDQDGDQDEDDRRVEKEFGFWHQKQLGGLWTKVGTIKMEDLQEVEAKVTGFSRYAMASN